MSQEQDLIQLRRGALQASLDAIITIDQQGTVVDWNPAAENTFGYLQQEALGQPMHLLIIPPAFREGHLQGVQRFLNTRVVHIAGQRVEVEAMRKGGATFPCEISFHPIELASGMYFTAYLRDLTERKRFEMALQDREHRLKDLSDAQARFVSEVSHEIKTPLAGIQGNLEVLRRYPHIPEEEKMEIIEDCFRETLRLGRLVGDMLGLSRGAQLQMMEDDLRLDQLVLEAVRDLMHTRGRKTLTLGHLDPCMVLGDTDRIRQLLVILVGNALKYTPDGGEVTVEVHAFAEGAQLRVQDTGVGIPAEDLERVFERFYRSDHSPLAGDPGGSGLGLSIARWIVQSHGGSIHLESEVGKGTTAVVQFPQVVPV